MQSEHTIYGRAHQFGDHAAGPESIKSDAWTEYAEQHRSFETAFWLHQFTGIAGGHRFYVGRTGSAMAQLIFGLGSLLAALAAMKFSSGLAVLFALIFMATGIWEWFDSYNLRDMVREHNHALARQLGLQPADVEWWERAGGEAASERRY